MADGCREIQVGGHIGNSQRGVALVDNADAGMIGAHSWSMMHGYAVRVSRVGGKQRTVRMHRFILGLGPSDPDVDHVNGNKLDNRRENLRPCTMVQNQQNLHQCGPYRGASWDAENRRWRARVKLNGKQHCLGRFATQAEAAAVAAAFRRTHMPFSADAREAA